MSPRQLLRRSSGPNSRLVDTARLTLIGLALLAGATGARPADAPVCPPQAQPMILEQAQAGLREARDRGFLWRMTRDGRDSYLFGTMHIAMPQWMFPGPLTAHALEASDIVALELDMLDADIRRRLAVAMLADSDERLPDALAERLRAQWRAACLPQETMMQLAAAVQLAALTTLAGRWDGLDPAYAIDYFLAGYARAARKQVISLETPELQVALLKGDPSSTEETLAHGLDQLERGTTRPLLVHLAQVWAEGREAELGRYEEWCDCADTESDRASLKRLLDERNPLLADRIEALHNEGHRVFAAVGALHMVGPIGLPELMTQRGFIVERVVLRP